MDIIHDVKLTPLKVISTDNGGVMHALRNFEESFCGFGEAYFSIVKYQAIKGWKKHTKMTLNLVVPIGSIRFIMYDDRTGSQTKGVFQEVVLSPIHYHRLTVPPNIWMAFQGKSEGSNILLNIANISHDPSEAENLPLNNEIIRFVKF